MLQAAEKSWPLMLPYLHKKMTLGENSVHKLIRASGAMEKNRRKTTISSKFGLGCFSYDLLFS